MNHRAFTLMELMIVIVIIGILAAVGLMLFGDFSLKAKKAVAAANYKQITIRSTGGIKIKPPP